MTHAIRWQLVLGLARAGLQLAVLSWRWKRSDLWSEAIEATSPVPRFILSGAMPHAFSRWLLFACSLLVSLALAASALAFTPPPIEGYITDVDHHLDAEALRTLDAHLKEIHEATGHQIAFLLLDSLNGEPIEDVAYETAKAWRPGRVGKDDGVVVVLALLDRKIRIEVGKGIEDRLPDLRASDIIREAIAPALRQGDAAGAIRRGADAIRDALGRDAPDQLPTTHGSPGPVVLGLVGVCGALFVWAWIMYSRSKQKQAADGLSLDSDPDGSAFRSGLSRWAYKAESASSSHSRSPGTSVDDAGSWSDSSSGGGSDSTDSSSYSGDDSSSSYSGGDGDFGGGGASGDF